MLIRYRLKLVRDAHQISHGHDSVLCKRAVKSTPGVVSFCASCFAIMGYVHAERTCTADVSVPCYADALPYLNRWV